MIHITIDGKIYKANKGDTILDVARRNKIDIPTLCYKEWAEPQGRCRLCSVEITKTSWNGWRKVVTSCNYPVQDGLIVYTKSEKIINIRKTLIELLLARCPNTPLIQKLAQEYNIIETDFIKRYEPDDCILCGLCVEACRTIGANAISLVNRGIEKKVSTPYDEPNNDCIGCACCANVCPTNNIKYEEDGNIRKIWNKEFELHKCSECGRAFITKAQLSHFLKKTNLPKEYFDKCEKCHQKETIQTFFKISNPELKVK